MLDRTRLRLFVLVIVHTTATIALDQFADYGLVAYLLTCLSLSQIGLLAIGLVFGTWRLRWRFALVVAGTTALVLWQWHSQGGSVGGLLGIVVSELSVAAGLLVTRYGPPKLRLIQVSETVFPSTRFQFSLRQVMTLFVVVALTLSAAKPIRAYISAFATEEAADFAVFQTIGLLVASLVLLSGFVVSWAAMWATLGTTGAWVKSTLVIMLALAIGSLFTYCIAPLFPDDVSKNWYFLPTLFMGESIFTMASLLVVRSCGYRLGGRKEMAT